MMARSPLLFLFAAVTLFTAAVAIVSGAALAATSVPGGNITGPTSWTAAGSPYLVDGTLTIDPGASLSIDAGVEVDINLTATIDVRGSLNATGTAASPVVFEWQGSPGGAFGGLRLLGVSAPSTLTNVTLRHAGRALYATAAAASVTFFDLRIENATVRAIELENSARALRIVRLSIVDTYDGILLTNVANLTFEGVSAGRFTYSGAWAVYGNTVQRTTFTDFVSAEGEVRLAGATEVAFWGFEVVGPEENWPLMVYGGATLRVDRFVRTISYSTGPFIQNVGGFWFTNFTIASPLFWPTVEALHIEGSPGARIVDGVIANAACGVCLTTSGLTELRNISITGGVKGVMLERSPTTLLDNVSITNMSQFGVWNEFSENSILASTAIVNASFPVRLGWFGGWVPIDISGGLTIDGVPSLGLYGVSGQTVSLDGRGLVFVWGSTNVTLTGGNITTRTSEAQVVIGNSQGTVLTGLSAVGAQAALFIVNSPNTTLERANLTGDAQALYAQGAPGLTVRNSTLKSLTAAPALGGAGITDGLFEDNEVTSLGTGVTDQGQRNTWRRLIVHADRAFEASGASFAVVEDSLLCGHVAVTGSTNVIVRRVDLCGVTSDGVRIAGGRGVTVEDVAFDGQANGVLLSGTSGATIRWNSFRGCSIAGVTVAAAAPSSGVIYENSFYCGGASAVDEAASDITWFNLSRLRGNFWEGYPGADADGDQVGDIAYAVPGAGRTDPYPLMRPLDRVAPVARVPANFTADADRPTVLDGALSSDDVGIANATWWINETGEPFGVEGLVANYTFHSTGIFEARLVVQDAWRNRAEAPVWITVVDVLGPAWQPPTLDARSLGAQVTLSAATAADQAGVATIAWKVDGATSSTGQFFTHTFFAVGNHTIELLLTDGLGFVASYTVTVAIVDTRAPVLGPGSFGADRVANQGEPLELDAAGFFVDDDSAFASTGTYAWSTSAPNASFTGPTDTDAATVTFLSVGAFTVVLRVADASGNFVEQMLNVLVIDAAAPTEVTWSVSPNGTVAAGATLQFSASASDPSGVGFVWDFGDGTSAAGASVSHSYAAAGQFRVNLTVADGAGNRVNRSTVLKVEAPAPPPGVGGEGLPLVPIALGVAGAAAAALLVLRRLRKTLPEQPPSRAPETPVIEPPASEYDRLYGGR